MSRFINSQTKQGTIQLVWVVIILLITGFSIAVSLPGTTGATSHIETKKVQSRVGGATGTGWNGSNVWVGSDHKAKWFRMDSYFAYHNKLWRTSHGCAANSTTNYKTLPWLGATNVGEVQSKTGFGTTGDDFSENGNCGDRYADGGAGSEIWIAPGSVGNWTGQNWSGHAGRTAKDTSDNTDGLDSGWLAGLGPRVWGIDQKLNGTDSGHGRNEHAVNLFRGNGYTSYLNHTTDAGEEIGLRSNGVTLFNQEFHLTQEEYDRLQEPDGEAVIEVRADDFYKVYVNATPITQQHESAEHYTSGDLKSLLQPGDNVIAVQVVDKARWHENPNVSNAAGLWYELSMDMPQRGHVRVQRIIEGTNTNTPSGNGGWVNLTGESSSSNNPHQWSDLSPGGRTLTADFSYSRGDATYRRTGFRNCGLSSCNSSTHRWPSTSSSSLGINVESGETRYTRAYYTIDRPPRINFDANCTTISGSVSDPDHSGPFSGTVRVRRSSGDYDDISFTTNSSGGFSVDYPEGRQTNQTHTVRVTAQGRRSDGSESGAKTHTTGWQTVGECFAASCSGSDHNPPAVLAGTDFSTEATFHNDGQLRWDQQSGRVTTEGVHSSATRRPSVPSTPPGGSATMTYEPFTAPDDTLDQQTVTMRLFVDGTPFAECTRSLDPYTEYILSAHITADDLLPNPENPDKYRLESEVTVEYDPEVSGPPLVQGPEAVREARVDQQPGSTATISPSEYRSSPEYEADFGDEFNINGEHQPGDEFCGRITVGPTEGWINRHGDIINRSGGPSTDEANCETAHDQPYVSTFGADVIAAGDFGVGNCGGGTGVINTYFDNNNNRGSGAQFAAIAINEINEFASAKMRTGDPTPRKGLTFANSGGSDAGSAYGGGYPGSHCITDYASYFDPDDLGNTQFTNNNTVSNLDNGAYKLTNRNPASGGGGIEIEDGKSITLYKEDNHVQIRNNIVYENESWNIENIPSFYLIVVGHNIYIDHDVDQLDGVYIAQPDGDGDGGKIYTCRDPDNDVTPMPKERIFNECDTPLTVNGALVANNIRFNRYGGSSLRYGNQAEHPLSNDDNDCANESRAVCAAETIMLSPEVYLTRPQLPIIDSPGQGAYDAITSLTPVF